MPDLHRRYFLHVGDALGIGRSDSNCECIETGWSRTVRMRSRLIHPVAGGEDGAFRSRISAPGRRRPASERSARPVRPFRRGLWRLVPCRFLNARHRQHRRRKIDEAYQILADAARFDLAWPAHDQRHVNAAIVHPPLAAAHRLRSPVSITPTFGVIRHALPRNFRTSLRIALAKDLVSKRFFSRCLIFSRNCLSSVINSFGLILVECLKKVNISSSTTVRFFIFAMNL